MGLDVMMSRITQRGTSPKGRRSAGVDFVRDTDDVFARLCADSRLPMLNRADPYGDLLLTQADMSQFLSEIDATRTLTTGQDAHAVLDAIRLLAERCAQEAALELHLQGA